MPCIFKCNMAFVDASLKRMMFHRRLSLSFSLYTSFYLSLCLTALFLLFTCEFQSLGLYLCVHFPVPKGVSCPSPHHNCIYLSLFQWIFFLCFLFMSLLITEFLFLPSFFLSLLPDVSNAEVQI